jgi:trk system potassium uptake protein TrkH
MRINAVLHYLGLIITIIGLTMLLPLLWSLCHGESAAASAFIISMAISIATGLVLWRFIPLKERNLSRREAVSLVAFGWICISLFGALPYTISGALPNYLDAFFESASGFTTTGATVFTNIDAQYQGILMWRSLTQWLGGMGIVMLFVALFPLLGIGASRLAEAEWTGGQQGERLTSRMRDTAKALWLIYLGMSALEMILLLIAGLPIFDALVVTLSTIPTGGFAAYNLSITAYNSLVVEGIVLFFMVASGVNFGLYYYLLWKRQPGKLFKNSEFRFYLLLLFGAAVLINADLVINMGMSVGDAIRYGTFQTASVMTTTGFCTADFNTWPPLSKAILLFLMVTGASAGSTSGALKVIRILVLAKYAYRQIKLVFNPRAVIPLKIGGNVVSESVATKTVSMAIIYFSVAVTAFLIMSGLGLDTVTALSAVVSAIGNVGPGLGAVGPLENFASVPALGKGVLIFCMIAGRLEFFTMLMLFIPAFWKWK